MRSDLVRMANHIARQFDHLPAGEAGVALLTHLNSFWSPAMRRELLRHIADEPAALHPSVVASAGGLRQRLTAPT